MSDGPGAVGADDKKKSDRTPWAVVETLGLRLIDRGHPITFLAFAALVLLGFAVWKMPAEAVGNIPRDLVGFLEHQNFTVVALACTSAFLTVACTVLIGVVIRQRRVYGTEIDRMAVVIREHETRLDAERPATYEPTVKALPAPSKLAKGKSK